MKSQLPSQRLAKMFSEFETFNLKTGTALDEESQERCDTIEENLEFLIEDLTAAGL